MFKRDFSRESSAGSAIRIYRAIICRVRGWLLLRLGIVTGTKGSRLVIGKNFEIKNGKNIFINGRVKIGNYARLECHAINSTNNPGVILLNDEVSLGNNVHIGSVNEVNLESGVLLGSNVLIIDHNHGCQKDHVANTELPPKFRELSSKGKIKIKKNSWVCDGVVLLAGIVIGENSIIGANTVVRNNVKAGNTIK